MGIKIINLSRCTNWGKPGDVRIDRETPYGNPFIMKVNTIEERMRVLKEFEIWILDQDDFFTPELMFAKRLGCWCAPLPCHGNIIAGEIERRKYCHE